MKPLANLDQVRFYNTSSGNQLSVYSWFLDHNLNDTVKEKDPIHIYGQSGIYPVVLIAYNLWGCADTIIKPVIVDEELNLYVPDAFTPNGDGLNDIFMPKGQGMQKYSMEVFDRWGESVFYSINMETGWDGSKKGEICKPDVYTWKIQLSDHLGKARTFTGQVSLLK
jgi:gliding motility-associated-like protein